jgi:hypothetical protein
MGGVIGPVEGSGGRIVDLDHLLDYGIEAAAATTIVGRKKKKLRILAGKCGNGVTP